MRLFCMSTCLISLWVLSLAANSFGELLMIREPVDSNGEISLTCVAKDDGAALILNLGLESSPEPVDNIPSLPRFSTSATLKKCRKTVKNTINNNWTYVNSVKQPMGPVFDYRWEGFKEFSFESSLNKNYPTEIYPNSGTLVFSVKGLGDIHVLQCKSQTQPNDLCSRVTIAAWPNKASIIHSSPNEMSGEAISSKTRQEVKLYDEFNKPYISEYEWQTFILNWNTTQLTIQANGSSVSAKSKTFPTDEPFTNIYVQSLKPGRIRFHSYNYSLTTMTGAKLYKQILNPNKRSLCIELLVSLCSECSLSIGVMNSEYLNIGTIGTIFGNEESAPDTLSAWRFETLNTRLPYNHPTLVTLEIITQMHKYADNGRWAIDRVRSCRAVDAARNKSLSFIPKTRYPTASCQQLSYTENSVVRTDTEKTHISSNLQECLRGKVSASCERQRSKWSNGTSFCDRSGCFCAPGFQGNNCQTECSDGFYGFDCQESFIHCKGRAYSKTNGSYPGDCTYHHLPPYHETTPNDPVNLKVTSQGKGAVTLSWDHACAQISQFEVKAVCVESKLREKPSENFPISKNYTMLQNQRECTSKTNLELSTATLYNISVRAINVDGPSKAAIVLFQVPTSIGFSSGEMPEANHHGTFIILTVPAVVNTTDNSRVKVVVKGPPPCTHPEVPINLKKLCNISGSEMAWIADNYDIHENEPRNLTIPKDSTCLLRASETYRVLIILEVDNLTSVIPVLLSTTPDISTHQNPGPAGSNLWIGILLFMLICVFLLFIWRRKFLNGVKQMRRRNLVSYLQALLDFVKLTTTGTSQSSLPLSTNAGLSGIVSLQEAVAWHQYSNPVDIKDFEDYVKDSIANGLLKSQYMTFPRGLNRPCTYGALSKNRPKNRYANIIAYDDTRVILKKIPDDPHSDYINANYVQGFGKEKAYIAAQGPKPQTLSDFWRMIWQEEALIICMLANIIERKMVKCAQYWPEFGKSITYDDIVIVTEKHEVFADYTFRTFRVSCKEESRTIEHLHYTGWPDHTVPMYANSVIAYLKKLQATPIGQGPIIVHCSAGVGRTGTIILCDICLRSAATKGTVDVLAEFEKLRDARLNMVDNELQYLFVHLIIAECLVSQPTDLDCNNDLPQAVEQLKKKLPQHMERLRETAWQDQALHPQISVRPPLPEHLAKNRFPELAPVSSGLVYLERYPTSDNNSDYISAVIVDGARMKKQYLASQLPLPSTLPDFWRLIAEQKIELVVILQQPDSNDPTCCEIIPGQEPLNPVPFLNVELKASSDPEIPPRIVELLLTDTSAVTPRTQRVTALTCTDWGMGKGGKPPPPQELVELWTATENIHREKGPTLVLCHDGVTGCGLYLALSFLLERMTVERECDIIFAVRAIRRSRAEFVQSQEQFEYLYDVAAKYVESFETYANFA